MVTDEMIRIAEAIEMMIAIFSETRLFGSPALGKLGISTVAQSISESSTTGEAPPLTWSDQHFHVD